MRVDPRDLPNPRRMYSQLLTLPMLAILVFALGVVLGVRGTDITVLGLALITFVVSWIPLALDQARPALQRRTLLAIFCLVYMAYFVAPAFNYYIPAEGPVDAPGMAFTQLRPEHIVIGQLVALAGLFSVLFGHALAGARWLSSLVPRSTRDWPPTTVTVVGLFMIVMGWGIQVLAGGGFLPAALGSGLVSTLGSALIYGNVLLTYAVLRYRSPIAFLALAVTIPVTSALGFFTGSKTAVLIVPLVVVLTVMLYRRRIRAIWLVFGVVALSLLYPASYFFRQVILVENTLSAVDALRNPSATVSRVSQFLSGNKASEYFSEGIELTGARLDGLGLVSVIVRDTPRRVPYQNGRTLTLFFVSFVPRGLWPTKPEITIGQWITDNYGSGPEVESNTACSMLGDFYLNFGLAGAICGMVLLGMILRVSHDSLLAGLPTAPAMLAAIIILYQLTVRFEGNVAAQLSGAVMALLPILVTHLVIRTIGGRQRAMAAGARPGSEAGGEGRIGASRART